MAHDVFISYSGHDKHIADAICSVFENSKIRCWIAPRDVLPGSDWARSINSAIKSAKLMVLVFSQSSNVSTQCIREVGLAIKAELPVIPFKIDNSDPTGSMEYHLQSTHWMDAVGKDTQKEIRKLLNVVVSILSQPAPDGNADTPKDAPPKQTDSAPEQAKKAMAKDYFSAYVNLFWKSPFDKSLRLTKADQMHAFLVHLIVFVILLLFSPIAITYLLLSFISLNIYCSTRAVQKGWRGKVWALWLLAVILLFILVSYY